MGGCRGEVIKEPHYVPPVQEWDDEMVNDVMGE